MIPAITNHLWQSTLFAAIAAVITFTLRRHGAQVRYWVWFAASMKFLVPFSLLTGLGAQFSWRQPTSDTTPYVATMMEQTVQAIAVPLSTVAAAALKPRFDPVPLAIVVWGFGVVAVLFNWTCRWLRIRRVLLASSPRELDFPVPVRESQCLVEPGVVGVLRPVLLLPQGLAESLAEQQLLAILGHERCHVRRRDNLTAYLHMLVEAAFWFNPLVWWIGARLVEERERACDEEVVRLGGEPRAYAEGILRICRMYIETPLACIPGVTGADLKKRVEGIMAASYPLPLSYAKRIALAALGAGILLAPLAIGILSIRVLRAQNSEDWQKAAGGKMSFDAASVKPAAAFHPPNFPLNNQDAKALGGHFSAAFALTTYIGFAYKLSPDENVRMRSEPQPPWVLTQFYEINAETPGNPSKDQMRLMMQSLLAERFKLAVHFEMREASVYALTLVKPGITGPKLRPHSEGPPCPGSYVTLPGPPTGRGEVPSNCGTTSMMMMKDGIATLASRDTTMARIADAIYSSGSVNGEMDKPVIDRTGLTGMYDFNVEFTPSAQFLHPPGGDTPAAPPDPTGTAFLTAVREQLGLKLVAAKGQVRLLVIDHVEKPSEN